MMRLFVIHTSSGRKLRTWGETLEAAERRVQADLDREGQGEEVHNSSELAAHLQSR